MGFLIYSDAVLTAGTRPDRYMALESRISDMPIEYNRNFKFDAGHPVNGCLLTGDPAHIAHLRGEVRPGGGDIPPGSGLRVDVSDCEKIGGFNQYDTPDKA